VDNIIKKVAEVEVEEVDKQQLVFEDDDEYEDQNIDELKDKGKSKDWAQREIALNQIKEELKSNENAVTNSNFANT
jgi:hypothetical protein